MQKDECCAGVLALFCIVLLLVGICLAIRGCVPQQHPVPCLVAP